MERPLAHGNLQRVVLSGLRCRKVLEMEAVGVKLGAVDEEAEVTDRKSRGFRTRLLGE
jgi:hypothetical protein